MFTLFKKTIYDFRWTFACFTVIAVAYVGIISSMYPTVHENAEQFQKIFDSMPQGMMEAFGVTTQYLQSFQGFISVEYFSFMFILILSIFTFILGSSLVVGEVDRGTSEFTFTLPVRRSGILAGKLLASYAMILAMVVLVLAAVAVGGAVNDEPVSMKGILAFFSVLAALSFFLLSVSSLCSSLFSRRGLANSAMGGFLGASYALLLLKGMTEWADEIYVFSFFKYYGSPQDLLLSADMAKSSPLVLALVGASLVVISFLVTAERDL